MSQQGSQQAIDELINLSYQFNDHRILHQTLQALGRTGQPQANEALLGALRRNLQDRVEVIRICSYFAPSSGALETSIVDDLLEMDEDEATDPDARGALLNTVTRKGGHYGREQVRDLRRSDQEEPRTGRRP